MRTLSSFCILALFGIGCASDEAPANQLLGVRILATRADKPFARPGESVNLEVLAVDGRRAQKSPMKTFFLPTLCVNPERDDPQKCPVPTEYEVGTNLNSQLVEGATYTITLPESILATHPPAPGADLPYGIAFVTVIACAGHVERLLPGARFPKAPAFACFNEQGEQLSKDDYVVAHARVLGYQDLRNANPVLDGLTVDGKLLEDKGFSVPRCKESDDRNCTTVKIDALIPEMTQEIDTSVGGAGNQAAPIREQIWVSYFVTGGKMENDLSVIYDAQSGKLPTTRNGLFVRDTETLSTHTLYAVAHDNRGGVSFRQIPFTLQ
jgi:hypothetical protein